MVLNATKIIQVSPSLSIYTDFTFCQSGVRLNFIIFKNNDFILGHRLEYKPQTVNKYDCISLFLIKLISVGTLNHLICFTGHTNLFWFQLWVKKFLYTWDHGMIVYMYYGVNGLEELPVTLKWKYDKI